MSNIAPEAVPGERRAAALAAMESPGQKTLLKTGALQDASFNSAYLAADVVNKITSAEISDPKELIAQAVALSDELDTPITPGFQALAFERRRHCWNSVCATSSSTHDHSRHRKIQQRVRRPSQARLATTLERKRMATVLVVEDNPTNMKLACVLLGKAGHVVLRADDAETGLTLTRSARPDLVLMDIQLPGMDGLAAAALLKMDPATVNIPVIALTSRAMKEDQERSQIAGCDAFMTKPLRYQQLYAVIDSLLNKGKSSTGADPVGAIP